MKEYFYSYAYETGAPWIKGSGEQGDAAAQQLPPGFGVIVVPAAAYADGLDTVSVDVLRSAVWDQVKLKRDRVIDSGCNIPDIGRIDTDEISRTNIMGAVTGAMLAKSASAPFEVNWKMQDNSLFHVEDADTMIAIGLAVLAFVTAAHARSQDLGTTIQEAADMTALLQIDISTGWPE